MSKGKKGFTTKFQYFSLLSRRERIPRVILEGERLEQPAKITDVTLLFLVKAKGLTLTLSLPKQLT